MESEIVSPNEVEKICPLLRTDDLVVRITTAFHQSQLTLTLFVSLTHTHTRDTGSFLHCK